MPTVGEHFGHETPSPLGRRVHNSLASNVRVGLEVEWEGLHVHTPEPGGWRCIPDGSLRDNGIEMVFRGPRGGQALLTRLDNLEAWIPAGDYTPTLSERTSFHVHVDVRHMEWEQLWRMIVLYIVTEPYLFHVCGKHREENIYCMAVDKGQRQIRFIKDLCTTRGAGHLGRALPKYASVNFQSLQEFGSLEFRGHEGTDSKERMLLWINQLLCLQKWAMESDVAVRDIPAHMSRLDAEGFLQEVFGGFQMRGIPGVADDVFRGVWNAEDVLFHDEMMSEADRLDAYRVEGPTSDLLTAFGVSDREAARGPSLSRVRVLDSIVIPRNATWARVEPAPHPEPGEVADVGSSFRGVHHSNLRVLLESSLVAACRDVLAPHVVREDNTISCIKARQFLRAMIDEDTDITPTPEGLGRIGTMYDVRRPPRDTQEYIRGMGGTSPVRGRPTTF